MPGCLTESAIQDLLEGRGSPEQVADLHRHVAECQDCCLLLGAVARSPTADPAGEPAPADRLPTGASPDPAPIHPSSACSLEVGQTLGNYLVVRRIGAGGFGVVFEAVHLRIKHRAAIKVLHPHLFRNAAIASRFLNEARAANAVQHPGIVRIFEMGQLPDGAAYLIMEYLEGEPLSDRFDRTGKGLGPAMLSLCQQAAEILTAAHDKGIIHRDLKLDNMMIVSDPHVSGGERVKLLDFGLAKVTQADLSGAPVRTDSGAIMGTPIYMSPEQCRGSSQIDGKSDVYTLGVMLYELATGSPPFTGRSAGELIAMHQRDAPLSPRVLEPALPDDLVVLIERMLAKDPAGRPTMREVARACQALLVRSVPGERGAGADAGVPSVSLAPPRRDWRVPAGLLAAALVSSALILTLFWPRYLGRVQRDCPQGFSFREGVGCVPLVIGPTPGPPAGEKGTEDHIVVASSASGPSPALPASQLRPAMMRIRPGELWMGSPAGEADREDDEDLHKVQITRGFLLSETEVTQAQYQAALGTNPSYFNGPKEAPVDDVKWFDALAYCNRLSELEGVERCYELRPQENMARWVKGLGCAGYRLPTEAEWEHAARGGRDEKYAGSDDPAQVAWFGEGTAGRTHRTKGKAANGWGLFDMSGNVWEWVWDWYGKYPVEPVSDPLGPQSGSRRVVRGGSFHYPSRHLRVACRDRRDPDISLRSLGFRVARSWPIQY